MTILTLALLVCLGTQSLSYTQDVPTLTELINARLSAAASAYRDGKFAEAEQLCRTAVEFDPNHKLARAFLARTVHAQYRPGVTTEENLAKARQAIEEYRNMLKLSPKDEEAYKAIAYLFGALKEYQQLREWILKRAKDESFEAEKRSQAYIVLASKNWDCSFKVTEEIQNKVTTVDAKGKASVIYKMPKNPADFQTASSCVSEGLTEIDQAIFLDPTSESAWVYKYNLLLERSKLLLMERKIYQKAQIDKLADTVLKQVERLQKPKP